MIKVSDYIVKRLEELGVRHVFMISGGGAMHLNDSFGRSEKIQYICNHHEQASAFAAEGYSRVSGKLAVVCTTTGPGGINALNGVFGQWTDSVPVLYISGQVKRETLITSYPEIPLRQLGDQEADIISVVKSITKYAKQVTKPEEIRVVLDEAINIALSGRPGPVWIDVPLDVQGAFADEEELKPTLNRHCEEAQSADAAIYPNINDGNDWIASSQAPRNDNSHLNTVFQDLQNAKRPLIVAGNGINISGTRKEFYNFIEGLWIPVVTTHNGFDIMETDHPLYIGRIGTIGQRAGNFALQNADLILFLGTRNNIRQVSYDWKNFGKNAKKIAVDIDLAELNKPTSDLDIKIHADLRDFFRTETRAAKPPHYPHVKGKGDFSQWLSWCRERKEKYPVVLQEYKEVLNAVNPYYFVQTLTKNLKEGAVTVTGNGTASVCTFQAAVVKKNQRFIVNSGNASMGYDLPAAIGAAVATGKEVVCLAGDGSIMMNLQELQTVAHNKLPIKIFVLDNQGYVSIRQTQNNFFGGNFVASGRDSGVSMPDFMKIAEAFGLPCKKICSHENMEEEIQKILASDSAVVCEVMLQTDYIFSPKHSSQKLSDGTFVSKPLEDMFPFLEREEFAQNMPAWGKYDF